MDKQFYTAQIIRFTTASISLICSSIMAIMISISEDGFTKPYRRIIFGLSVSDILQSVGFIASPFAAPRGTPGSTWAVGNTSSCEAIGFIFTAGGTMLPMYTFMLTSYFLLRVKYKMTIKDYAKKVEWKFHAFIIIWNVTSSIIALRQDLYNPTRAGSLCTMRECPLNCHSDLELAGQCDRGEGSRKFSMILVFIPTLTSFIGMVVSLVILNVYVVEHEIIYTNIKNSSSCCQKRAQTIKNLFWFGAPPPEVDGSEPPVPVQSRECIRQRSNARAALVQSSLYLISFSVTYFFIAFDYLYYVVSNGDNPNWTFLPISIFLPIGGLLNIMVYTRPKVLSLMDRYPDFPKFVLFLLVVVSGGEAPEEAAIEAALRSLELEQAAAPGGVSSGNNMEEVYDDDLPSNVCFDIDRVLSSDLSLSQSDERKKSGFWASTMSLDP